MRETRYSHKILAGKYCEKILLGRILTRWENNKVALKERFLRILTGLKWLRNVQ
jgi:hypothetical protein